MHRGWKSNPRLPDHKPDALTTEPRYTICHPSVFRSAGHYEQAVPILLDIAAISPMTGAQFNKSHGSDANGRVDNGQQQQVQQHLLLAKQRHQ
ncbi:hypothetical protein ElyMa_003667900 [Elysia marginata]|uniref:Uncharacterized protein n=1 Tax=Elysia marginata TaxID=1093978 RepID=A0AAV4EYK2_9GAST|nr:hypothetical protein ElyMa_003667900 [Elysia marginata]